MKSLMLISAAATLVLCLSACDTGPGPYAPGYAGYSNYYAGYPNYYGYPYYGGYYLGGVYYPPRDRRHFAEHGNPGGHGGSAPAYHARPHD